MLLLTIRGVGIYTRLGAMPTLVVGMVVVCKLGVMPTLRVGMAPVRVGMAPVRQPSRLAFPISPFPPFPPLHTQSPRSAEVLL